MNNTILQAILFKNQESSSEELEEDEPGEFNLLGRTSLEREGVTTHKLSMAHDG